MISSIWKNVWYQTTVKFIPPITYGKVVKVYDGDTITVASPLPNTIEPIYRFSIRLRDIDSPEIKGKTEKEKELAEIARNALSLKLLYKMVLLENIDTEKYGRILADVYLAQEREEREESEDKKEKLEKAESISISNWMLQNGYAVPYNGGTKVRPKEWDNSDSESESVKELEKEKEADNYYKISTW